MISARTRRVAFAAQALLVCSGAGCTSKDAPEQQKLTRNSGQPAVVLVGVTNTSNKDALAEVEPNGELGEALLLAEEKAAKGVLEGSKDVDRFSFLAPKAGLLFASVKGASPADLTFSLHDTAGSVLAKSDRGPAGTTEGLAGYGVEAGVTYQLVVGEFVGRKLRKAGGRSGPSGEYRVEWRIQDDAEPGFESEPNADETGASEVIIGEERKGFLGWGGDIDLWRLPITGFDEVSGNAAALPKEALHVHVSAIPGVATKVAILAAGGETILERQARKGEELSVRNFLPAVGADTYSIRVSAKASNPVESYALRVESGEISPGTEEEPNDELQSATQLGDGEATLLLARGELSGSDVDYFQIAQVGFDRILELRLTGPSHADLDTAVIAESGAVIVEASTAMAGTGEILSQIPVARGVAPLIKVSAKALRGAAAYEVSLSLVRGTAPALVQPSVPDPSNGPEIPAGPE